ncbi:MAG: hypothetical protein EZS28_024300 [Streblomastix strix]|uniref:Uncharacterized protein n=1 Tax=Streblomastix strix TaxID=222440 RepID=A0A5J4VCL1_9EUKA|nr:MAG: hypothetical protein EZS28_024300 [Streblomastix strix]
MKEKVSYFVKQLPKTVKINFTQTVFVFQFMPLMENFATVESRLEIKTGYMLEIEIMVKFTIKAQNGDGQSVCGNVRVYLNVYVNVNYNLPCSQLFFPS